MNLNDIKKAQSLSKQLASMGYSSKKVVAKKKTPIRSTFAFDYESLKPKQDDSTLLLKQAVRAAQDASKQAADLAQTVADMNRRAANAETMAKTAAQTAIAATKAMDGMVKQIADMKAQEIKEDTEESIEEKQEELKEIEEEKPFEITQEMVKTIVKMMHGLPEMDKLEVSKGIRNAQSFIFGKTKYKMEEMMHGGGGTGGGSATVYTEAGIISDLNTLSASNTLTTIYSFAINGQFFHIGTDYTKSGTVITYTSPLSAELTGKPYTLVYSS